MDERVNQQKVFDGTKAWNDAGWDGSGIVVWNMEEMGNHGQMTRSRVFDAAPGCEVINKSHFITATSKEITSEYIEDEGAKVSADEFVKAHKIAILTHSHQGVGDKSQSRVELYKGLREKYNLSLFNSAGNDGSHGVRDGALPKSLSMFVGAAQLAYKKGVPQGIEMCQYSSIGDEYEEVDFSHFVGPGGWTGTSFSCPYLAGIGAILMQRYGRDMTHDEMYNYFKMTSMPIDTGHTTASANGQPYDLWAGYGMPILPSVDKQYVVMQIGRRAYKVDGAWEEMDVAPFIKESRTFVPIAFAAIALGAQVSWEARTRKVHIEKGDRFVDMFIGQKTLFQNGYPMQMDTAPFIKNSRTFVPIAFAALALNCKVAWVPSEQKVLILEQ